MLRFLSWTALLLLVSCSNGGNRTADDSLQQQVLRDSISHADSLKNHTPGCNPALCQLLADSADPGQIKQVLGTNSEVNCFCEFEGEITKLGAQIPIIKNFFRKKTRRYTYESSPLQYATGAGDTALMRLLLNAGADPNLADSGQNSPLQIAFYQENEACFNLLCSYGASMKGCYIDPVFHSEEWLLRCAEHGGDFNIPEYGQEFSGLDPKTHRPVMIRTTKLPIQQTWDHEKLKIMLEHGANPNDTSTGGKTLLHVLVDWGDEENIDLALRYKADIYAKDASGKTALHYAVLRDEPDLLARLFPLYDLKKAGIGLQELIALAESENKKACAAFLKKQKV